MKNFVNRKGILLLGGLVSLMSLLGFLIPDNIYRFPLDNHSRLSGTFGEPRPDHFHSGIDIKTGGRSGAPLYAVQDGYIYRIKVSPYGFGKAIYLRHPDGRFSVYGHMSRFQDYIEDYVRAQQYITKQFEQEIYLPKDRMPVRRNDLIGYSGNSGSSFGPHLHFEIRDPEEHILNPLAWYQPFVTDNIKPIVQEIGFEPLDPDSRMRGEFRKLILSPSGGNGKYQINTLVRVRGKFGIEYRAYDLLNGAGNHCGINYVKLYLDDQLIYAFDLDVFAFDEKRYINRHIDYAYYKNNKKRFEKAYRDYGNEFNAFGKLVNRGMIELKDNAIHTFRLELADGYQNTTTVTGRLQRNAETDPFAIRPFYSSAPRVSHEIRRNMLVITAENPHRSYHEGLNYINIYGENKILPPAYTRGQKMVFLLPLARNNYPERITDQTGRVDIKLNLQEEVFPYQNNLVELDELQLYFPYQSVFHPLHLEVVQKPGNDRMFSDIFIVGDKNIPLFKTYLVSFVANRPMDRAHLVVAKKEKGKWEFAGNTQGEENNVYAGIREFGEFCLMADSIAPEIVPINFSPSRSISGSQANLKVRVEDDFSGIDSKQIYCTIDDEWVPFEYNFKTDLITYVFPERLAAGEHILSVEAWDKANNRRQQTYTLRVY